MKKLIITLFLAIMAGCDRPQSGIVVEKRESTKYLVRVVPDRNRPTHEGEGWFTVTKEEYDHLVLGGTWKWSMPTNKKEPSQ